MSDTIFVFIQLPHVTSDEGEKGWILGWSWASDDVLVGRGLILDVTGHDMVEGRLYAFHLKEQALARLDLSALDLPDATEIEIASIGEDLKHLRIRLGDREFAVKADLKSPPRLLAKPESEPIPEADSITQLPAPTKSPEPTLRLPRPGEKPPSSTPWPLLAVVVAAAISLLWLFLKKRK